MKASNPLFLNGKFKFPAYSEDLSISPVFHIQKYMKRTENVPQILLLSFVKPSNPVSKDMFSRWLKQILLKT